VGAYDLTLKTTSTGESFAEAQTGSNNGIDQASSASFGATYKGQLSSFYDDVDFYRFTLAESGKVDLALNADIQWIYVKWYDAGGREISSKNLSWNGTTKKLAYADTTFLNSGTYFVAIQKNGGYVGAYDLTLRGASGVQSLTAAPTPTVSGSAQVGSTLTTGTGEWKPAPVTLAYQWLRDGNAISGATKSSYQLTAADAGRKISVTVTGSKSGYASASKTSAALSVPAVSQPPTDPATPGAPTIYSAGTKLVNVTTYTWGKFNTSRAISAWTEVLINGKWAVSQIRQTDSAGNYVIPLTYGAGTPGTYTFRVRGQYADGTFRASKNIELRRLGSPTVASAGSRKVNIATYTWGKFDTLSALTAWTEVKVNGKWLRSQTRLTDTSGNYVIPLTYGAGTPGTYTFRVRGQYTDGTIATTKEFALKRTAS